MTAETLPAAASADRLNDILRGSGKLENGSLSDVAVDTSWATILSCITRLRLTYKGGAPAAPPTLILKTSRPERTGKPNWDAGRQEVAFYNNVAATMQANLVQASCEPLLDSIGGEDIPECS